MIGKNKVLRRFTTSSHPSTMSIERHVTLRRSMGQIQTPAQKEVSKNLPRLVIDFDREKKRLFFPQEEQKRTKRNEIYR